MIARRPFLAALAVLAMTPALAGAVDLPDLEGRTVVVVTENAYPPLQFVDPKSGKAIGWEYDAMEEIARRLNFKVEYQNISWDAMIQSVSAGQYDIGMTGISIKDDRREKWISPSLICVRKCSCWCRRKPLYRRKKFRRLR
jgi:polar amino acid transport system substrate-binding protein